MDEDVHGTGVGPGYQFKLALKYGYVFANRKPGTCSQLIKVSKYTCKVHTVTREVVGREAIGPCSQTIRDVIDVKVSFCRPVYVVFGGPHNLP